MTTATSPPDSDDLHTLAAEYRVLDEAMQAWVGREVRRRRDLCAERILVLLDGTLRWAAREVSRHPAEVDDLVQEGRIHALVALRSWRPGLGASPRTWVRTHLLHELRRARKRLAEQTVRGVATLESEVVLPRAITARSAEEVCLNEVDVVSDAIDSLCRSLDPDDVQLIRRARRGESLRHAWERGRVRALLSHPSNAVPGTEGAVIADLAACRGGESGRYFPSRGRGVDAEVLGECVRCAVRTECILIASAHSTWTGCWGGTTHNERRLAVRRSRSARGSESGDPEPHTCRSRCERRERPEDCLEIDPRHDQTPPDTQHTDVGSQESSLCSGIAGALTDPQEAASGFN